MTIQILSTNTINKIAAGEVIDRPLSIVKELTENSIDAKASEIFIEISRGGRNFISVTDNGKGIKKEELPIALERHATSKLNEEDINNIQFLGFRGEALPSIASVSKMKIISKTPDNSAWEISISGGQKSDIKPVAHPVGTYIEIRDLFFTTPARLKFLKSEASETSTCIELVNKLALSREDISFKLISNEKKVIDTREQKVSILESNARVQDILGKHFIENTINFCSEYDGIKVYGYTSIPTFNVATSINQYFFINKRIVKDRVLSTAVRIAYRNLIPHNRAPQVVLYLEIDPQLVDVNVHPTKAEVRFRDEQRIRGIIIDAIRGAITKSNIRSSTKTSNEATRSFKHERMVKQQVQSKISEMYLQEEKGHKQARLSDLIKSHEVELGKKASYTDTDSDNVVKSHKVAFAEKKKKNKYISDFVAEEISKKQGQSVEDKGNECQLGFAKCQIDKTYIVAEKSDCLILVDQHAAHERLVLEKIKQQLKDGNVMSQILLVPEIVNLGQVLTEKIIEKTENLEKFGLGIERNGISQILVRQVAAILQDLNIKAFVMAIAENIHLFDNMNLIQEKIDEVWGNIACRSSIRAGRVLNIEEMNTLLREMEKTPLSGQCNHGRPTFIKLQLKDIRKIFERL